MTGQILAKMMKPHVEKIAASFRDPSGFVFTRDGRLYRQINTVYQEHYAQLMESGLYRALVDAGHLIPHQEVETEPCVGDGAYKVIEPQRIPFISYPYEWCFSQLKEAALLTLAIQKQALDYGMSLKDCSAYNIQWLDGRLVLIDTLSFERYIEGRPWVAYRQFCEHFLVPLALMSQTDIRLARLLMGNVDGVPLDLGSKLLPWQTRLRLALLMHIHLHAKSQTRYADKGKKRAATKLSRFRFLGLLSSLEAATRKLEWRPAGTEWIDYYDQTNYTTAAFDQKKKHVSEFLDVIQPRMVWDLGANTGEFSRIPADRDVLTIAFDIDPGAVEKSYHEFRAKDRSRILPLVLDLRNPSPGIGWHHRERMSLLQRGPVDAVFALALIHHLAVSNNLPFAELAGFFADAGEWLIVEFVPKSDSQVERLLATREDVFPNYTQSEFERVFSARFAIERSVRIHGTERTLYLMRRKDAH